MKLVLYPVYYLVYRNETWVVTDATQPGDEVLRRKSGDDAQRLCETMKSLLDEDKHASFLAWCETSLPVPFPNERRRRA